MGWLLALFFCFETTVYSLGSFKSKFSLRAQWVINVLNLCAYAALGTDSSGDASAVVLVVIFSCLRFQVLIKYLPRSDVLKAMTSILIRCALFYVLVLYFFAVIGHESFCNLYNTGFDSSSTDDAESWLNFSSLLNFDTFLSSCYTVAQVAILSNWSIVMDAGAKCSSSSSITAGVYIYFYAFRICAVWIVIPTMMSFLIQSFIQKLSKPVVVKPQSFIWQLLPPNHIHENTRSRSKSMNSLSLSSAMGFDQSELFNVSLKKKHTPDVMVQLWSASGKEVLPAVVSPFDMQIKELEASIDTAHSELEEMNKKITGMLARLYGPQPSLLQEKKLLQEQDMMLFYVAESQIVKEQQDWISLLRNQNIRQQENPNYFDHIQQGVQTVIDSVDKKHHAVIASIWFHDAINGHTVDYPQGAHSISVQALLFSKSFLFETLLYTFVVVQMVCIFFFVPRCSRDVEADTGESLISRESLSIFELVCSFLYIIDVLVDMYVHRTRRSKASWYLYLTSWSLVRVMCSILIPVNCIFILSGKSTDQENASVVRCLYPILLISRDENYKELVKGLFVSIRNTWMVYCLLLSLLTSFTFLGYFLFHPVGTDANHFANIATSFAVVLHCFTSAPYSLFVVNPYFSVSNASVLFFLLLSYSTEVFCIGLILATGTFFYRSFSDKTLKHRLLKRHEGITNIWKLLEDPVDHTMNLDDWLLFTSAIKSKYKVDPINAFDLYMYVCKSSPLDDMNKNADYSQETITQPQFFRLCALLFVGARCKNVDNLDQLLIIQQNASPHCTVDDQNIVDIVSSISISEQYPPPTLSTSHSQMEMVVAQRRKSMRESKSFSGSDTRKTRFSFFPWRFNKRLSSDVGNQSLISRSRSISGSKRKSKRSGSIVQFNEADNPLRQSSISSLPAAHSRASSTASSIASSTLSRHNIQSFPSKKRNAKYTFDGLYRGVNVLYVQEARPSLISCDFLSPALREWILKLVRFSQLVISIQLLGSLCIFEFVGLLMHILLIVQLSFFTSTEDTSQGWAGVGYLITAYFVLEMCLRLLAIGEQAYFRNNVFFIQCMLNLLSISFMIAMGPDIHGTNTFFLLTVLVQCGRLGLMLWIERGDDKLKYLLGVAARSLFLLISAIYCFGVVSQDIFCGVLPADTDPGAGSSDDDSSSWFVFASILNFNDYSLSLFTMFQVTVLGSWSMVMDAVARSVPNPVPIYLFFYLFRLLMTLCVLPILLSFLVRSSVALNDKIRNERQAREAQAKQLKEERKRLDEEEVGTAINPSESDSPKDIPTAPLPLLERLVQYLFQRFRPGRQQRQEEQQRSGLFSQYNISVSKHSGDMAFASIWTGDAGATESLQFLQILALSTQLENLKYNLDYHCEMLLRLVDQVKTMELSASRASAVSRRSLRSPTLSSPASAGFVTPLATSPPQEKSPISEPSSPHAGSSDALLEGDDEGITEKQLEDNTNVCRSLDLSEVDIMDTEGGVADGDVEGDEGEGDDEEEGDTDEQEDWEELEDVDHFIRARAKTRETLVSYMT
eukprot:CAMPEP_0201110792 /NCGR_PEP_ID=MMETSP0812-20130820/72008_1 /ASSEMBLY_ACC=CAM_ASM_000668 /TAXON_ID=98059 /ORGANISM="Dinobryon sp., Strain UTEXLB2267" /LENGTH=1526 /DNA_ID=CAMNT_0047373441 /DNA_START=279 /DNA_END=4859 /DNA_ORIENTATION=+